MKTFLGIQQQQEGLRTAAYIIHCSLVEKKYRGDITQLMPLPFDDKEEKSTLPGWNAAQMRLLRKEQAKKLQANG